MPPPSSLILTLRRIRTNDQLPNLQRRIRARQPFRHDARVRRLAFAMLRRFGVRQVFIHGDGTRANPVAGHVRVGYIFDDVVPGLWYFPYARCGVSGAALRRGEEV